MLLTLKAILSFHFSEVIGIPFLTLVSVLVFFCLFKANMRSLRKLIRNRAQNIPLQERNSFHITNILLGTDKPAMKRLLDQQTNQDTSLKTILLMMNMKGSGPEIRQDRRRVNNFVMDCLVDVMGSRPLALVWLKRHISLETCKTMLKDEKYKGTIETLSFQFFLKT